MSYRLIDSNALTMRCKEVNDMPCIYADLPNGLDDGYYDLTRDNENKSRWHELFGTPERAARTLHELCGGCCGLPECVRDDYDALLEWLMEVRDE